MSVWETLGLGVRICCFRLHYMVPVHWVHWKREIQNFCVLPGIASIVFALRRSTWVLGSKLVLTNNLMNNLIT